MRVTLLTLLVALLLIPVAAAAATTVTSQQQFLDVTVQSGNNQSFYLVFTAVEPSNITASGNIASWVTFGDSNTQNHTFSALGSLTILKVTIAAPNGTVEGKHTAYINADNVIISTVKVTVVPSLANITTLRNLADVNVQLSNLRSDISSLSSKVGTNKNKVIDEVKVVKQKVEKIKSSQDRVTVLEQENAELEGRVKSLNTNIETLYENSNETTELQQNLDKITGQVTVERNFSFGAGFIVGAVVIYLLFRRKLVKRAVSQRLINRTNSPVPTQGTTEAQSKNKLLLSLPFVIPAVAIVLLLLL